MMHKKSHKDLCIYTKFKSIRKKRVQKNIYIII